MFEYISSIERNGVEYKIHDETIASCELLVNGVITQSFVDALTNAQGKVNFKLLNNVETMKDLYES